MYSEGFHNDGEFICVTPSPNCIPMALAREVISLTLILFLFDVQMIKDEDEKKGKTMSNFYLMNPRPLNCISRVLARGPISLIFLLLFPSFIFFIVATVFGAPLGVMCDWSLL